MKNLLKQISKIDNSEDLNVVIDAIKAQRKIINNVKVARARNKFKAGDMVKVNGKKTNGDVGMIIKMKIKRAIVEIDGTSWDCPLSILEVA
tara:strand:+ start:1217 stop:1489 length:273 start_codon:yes stop_codon:yes gene_type:complete